MKNNWASFTNTRIDEQLQIHYDLFQKTIYTDSTTERSDQKQTIEL